jgi:hypothetical protein
MSESDPSDRITHLLRHVQRTFDNIGLDAISRQMDLHPVSAAFTSSRLLEMFAMILGHERETLIAKTEQSLQAATDVKHGWRDRARSDRTEFTATLDSLRAENLRLRRELNQLESVEDEIHSKGRQIAFEFRNRTDALKAGFAHGASAVERVRQDCRDLSELLGEVRRDIGEIESAARSSIVTARQTMYSEISRRAECTRSKARVERLEARLRSERTKTVLRRDALNCAQNGGALLRKLSAEVARARHDPFGNLLDASTIPGHVRAEIERQVREQEAQYLPMLIKQKALMEKLEKELRRAERRLEELISVDGVAVPQLVEMLDAERKTMQGAQERTDTLMKKLQEGSFSSATRED